MRRVKLLAVVAMVLGTLFLLAGSASAQSDPRYAGQPGTAPIAGPTDTGGPSGEAGTQVLGQTFQRSGGESNFLASTGADILEVTAFGVVLIGLGIVLVRRTRRRGGPLEA